MGALDPAVTNQAQFEKLHREEILRVRRSNRLEPPFPYSMIPFKPGLFLKFFEQPKEAAK
jgi:hypothetical protein